MAPKRTGNRRPRTQDDVVKLIDADHKEVRQLFQEFEKGGDFAIVDQIMTALLAHTQKEEAVVYPHLQELDEDFFFEAHAEHDVVDMIMSQLANHTGEEGHYDAMVKVLQENVEHHIEEEEKMGFRLIRKLPQEVREEIVIAWNGAVTKTIAA